MPFGRARLAALALVASSAVARADDADPADAIVIRTGELTMRVSEVARRLAAIPPFQRETLGRTPDEIRRRFVETVLEPELLRSAEAERLDLQSSPALRHQLRDALRRALVEALRQDVTRAGIPAPEVAAYYDAHRDDYQRPERIRISRILVGDEALAKKILVDARGPGGPERFSALAREHSLDEATKLRGGMLGFVLPDGHTDVPQLAVNPVLYAAASKMKDGELVPEPIREGERFAVVWRRGTLPKTNRSLESEHDAITALLIRQRVEHAVADLLADLRKRDVHDENVALLDALPAGEPIPPSRERQSGILRAVRATPGLTERGLR